MKQSESLMTIVAVLIGLSLSLALVFGNFSFVYTLKLFREGNVPAGRYLFVLAVAAVNTGLIIWLAKLLYRVNRPTKTKQPLNKPVYPYQNEHVRQLVLTLARQQGRFSQNDVMLLTGLTLLESSYLLDELLGAELLELEEAQGNFGYRLKQVDSRLA